MFVSLRERGSSRCDGIIREDDEEYEREDFSFFLIVFLTERLYIAKECLFH